MRGSLEAVIAALAASLDAIETELGRQVAAEPGTKALSGNLRTLTGIGPVTATTLVADLPELGRLSAKQIAALVGFAPQTRESGRTRSRAATGHGDRPQVRRALFNAARAAIRYPSPRRDFYQRLVTQNRRPGKVALVAVMRKLLVIANAIARDNRPWSHRPLTRSTVDGRADPRIKSGVCHDDMAMNVCRDFKVGCCRLWVNLAPQHGVA